MLSLVSQPCKLEVEQGRAGGGDLHQGVEDLVGELGRGRAHRGGVPDIHDDLLGRLLHCRLLLLGLQGVFLRVGLEGEKGGGGGRGRKGK